MARLTRHDMKKDEFRTGLGEFEHFAKQHLKEIATVIGIFAVVVGSAYGIKTYMDRQETAAGVGLGAALKTFRAYVGPSSPGNPAPDPESYATAREKYKKALDQFSAIVRDYPRTKAAAVARYHVGVCQAQLGDDAAAVKTLQEASQASDRELASLARLALAGELVKTGKLAEAVKIYQDLADHPTTSVPRATALLEMAGAYRATQPAQARLIYERLEKEFGASDAYLAQSVKQQAETLPQ